MFVNFTNHPSEKWDRDQLNVASEYGEIVDIPFPEVDPAAGEDEIERLAEVCVDKITEMKPDCVLCQGEFCLTYKVVSILKEGGVNVVAACSKRVVSEMIIDGEIIKSSRFEFVQFREY